MVHSGGLRQALLWTSTAYHRKFMVYFADKKSTIGFCFASCYCIMIDDVNKEIGFHGNTSPPHKQRPLIKATQCQIFLIIRQSWYGSNALHT